MTSTNQEPATSIIKKNKGRKIKEKGSGDKEKGSKKGVKKGVTKKGSGDNY